MFPECGITSINIPDDPIDAVLFTAVMPDPKDKIVPCDSNGNWSNVC